MTRLTNPEIQKHLWKLLAKPYEPVLERATTALLCVDLQYLDASAEFGLGARAKGLGIAEVFEEYWERVERTVIPNVVRLQEAARRSGIEVIHCRVASVTSDGRDNSRRYRIMGTGTPLKTKDTEFIPEVAPRGDEIVINKLSSSPFNSTNIDRVLRNLGIKDLVVVGVVTDGCVESTVRSAAELDYGVYLVEDCTAALAPQLHESSILIMSYKDAAITTTDEILRKFEALAAH